jgi:ribosomal protein S12 methylthiotransferase accessory factor YcaO
MNTSAHLSRYLSSATRDAWAKASEDEGATPEVKPKTPPTPEVALLRRIKKIVFAPTVKDIPTALDRFNSIVESLDDSEEDDDKKPAEAK